jgi:hypothetical protein
MRSLLGVLALLAGLVVLGCTGKPIVKEKPVPDPLYMSKKPVNDSATGGAP